MSDRHRTTVSRAILIVLAVAALVVVGGGLYRNNTLARIAGTAETESAGEAATRAGREARATFDDEVANLGAEENAPHAPAVPIGAEGYFQPPDPSSIPDDEFGQSVRRGREIFLNPAANATEYVGNSLACANCHLDAGRLANAAPMWAAAGEYPAWRGKNKMINTMEDRVNGCFTYSMNAQASPSGAAPPKGHQIYKDLESYFYWLATGAPLNVELPGRGYPTPDMPEAGYDRERGREVFAARCSVCHGETGQGRQDINGRYVFPPLWGSDAYNWGAGMHRVNTAAGFIYANMPLGLPYSLSPQEAWDVAAWINSQERPADPRQSQGGLTVAEAQERFHSDDPGFYGAEVDGTVLGAGVSGDPADTPSATGTVVPDPAAPK
ncbi:thiosulfate dehydrogenase [Palleronia aestuarii]|uniref:Thiosulfate dehydrogenase n=1 Tax=Palleronia aestuarii TaxID=568105 RepID=A0A2W7MY95_9RHOB|nr:c-type cytochrome [Palleronia aestuarii]PZX12800.1 thiosulfate dehydrogenase [Palleronia aestuarii]